MFSIAKGVYLIIALVVGLLVGISFYYGLFSGLENFFEDLLYSPKPISGDLVIVAIDDESIQRIGQWPWPREVFAVALKNLEKTKPALVGVDVIFAEPSRVGLSDDAKLVAALKAVSYPVIFPVEQISSGFLKPLPQFQARARLGHVNLTLDNDGVARRFPLTIENYGAFAYEAVQAAGFKIPDSETLESLNRIVYAAPPGSIYRLPFWRIFEGEFGDEFKDRLVLIGATAADLHDDKPTPLGRGQHMAGVEIHANIANMLLRGYRLKELPDSLSYLWILTSAVAPALLPSVWLSLIIGAGYLVVGVVLFDNGIAANLIHIQLAWFLSFLAIFGYRYFIGEKKRRELKQAFSKYVSKEILEEILRDPSKVALGGEEKIITVLFSDIRNFTSWSEKTLPRDLVRMLNRYFSVVTGEILKHGGVVDKFIGDAIMAFWGAPINDPQQAERAFEAARGMIEQLDKFNEELKTKGEKELNIGIGIYTGPAVVGNVGSEARLNYTAIGDTVNVASRLEGLTKEHGVRLIIGESTKNKISGKHKFKFLGPAAVKGRQEAVNIYTVDA